jgi:hypothetical protein
MDTDRNNPPETCHSERSEESMGMRAGGHADGFFTLLRMTCMVEFHP